MTAFMPEHRADDTVRSTRQYVLPGALLRAAALALLLAFSSIAVVGAQESTPDATPSASPTPSPAMPRLELELGELNDSGITGTVTLYDAGDQTIVEFDVEGAGGDHPAHIHEGVCGDLNPEPAYPLENVDKNGESTTVLDVPIGDLLAEDYAVDMHLAPDELGTLIACADIVGEPELPEGATPEASPEATPSGNVGGTTTTESSTETATGTSDGTGGAAPTETSAPTATEVATEVSTAQTTPTPTAPVATETTTPAASLPTGQGDTSDGTGGAGAAVPMPSQSTGGAVGSDGTAGVSGKGEPVSASTLPQQAGVGSSLIWPESPAEAMMLATSGAAIVLGASAWVIRRGERSSMTTSSRWTRMGI